MFLEIERAEIFSCLVFLESEEIEVDLTMQPVQI
jgi:hypothetical protein